VTELVIFGLATWRIASLLVQEDGPFYMFYRLREKVGIGHDENRKVFMIPDRFFAQVLSCVWCSSIWVGFGWLAFWLWTPEIALKIAAAFSFSTVAIMIDRWVKV